MRIYYYYTKGVLQFHSTKKEWRVFYPKKGAKASRTGEVLSKDQVRCIVMNYKMKGKPVIHREVSND